ncbi:UNVERIFIED_CONTAM: hypothetical protein GTU68_045056 [Idotea baltica]|nr:hypothetical protein [Idotea baltica]
MSLPKIVLGSRNKKKSLEIAELLAPHSIELVSVAEFPEMGEVIEDGDSFAANAAKKATETATTTNHWAIGEDSGLCVDALKGAPGIYSARFSGEDATDERNNEKLISELADVPEAKRGAGYVCSVAVSDPSGTVQLAMEGTCRGRIIATPRGANGFGYDPYFLIPEYNATFGELGSIVKQQISHRARAFHRLIPKLVRLLTDG